MRHKGGRGLFSFRFSDLTKFCRVNGLFIDLFQILMEETGEVTVTSFGAIGGVEKERAEGFCWVVAIILLTQDPVKIVSDLL